MTKRWKANIEWVSASHVIDSQDDILIEEVEELQEFIEDGPAWTSGMTVKITMEYQR